MFEYYRKLSLKYRQIHFILSTVYFDRLISVTAMRNYLVRFRTFDMYVSNNLIGLIPPCARFSENGTQFLEDSEYMSMHKTMKYITCSIVDISLVCWMMYSFK